VVIEQLGKKFSCLLQQVEMVVVLGVKFVCFCKHCGNINNMTIKYIFVSPPLGTAASSPAHQQEVCGGNAESRAFIIHNEYVAVQSVLQVPPDC